MSEQPERYEGMDGRLRLRHPREPLIHTGITDGLADDHPLARQNVECVLCRRVVHAEHNECMDAWVETGKGPYCLNCFASAFEDDDGPAADWGLP